MGGKRNRCKKGRVGTRSRSQEEVHKSSREQTSWDTHRLLSWRGKERRTDVRKEGKERGTEVRKRDLRV